MEELLKYGLDLGIGTNSSRHFLSFCFIIYYRKTCSCLGDGKMGEKRKEN